LVSWARRSCHSLFVGSALATQDSHRAPTWRRITYLPLGVPRMRSRSFQFQPPSRYQHNAMPPPFHFASRRLVPSLPVHNATGIEGIISTRMSRHIYHGTVDIAISLLGFAVMINSLSLQLTLGCIVSWYWQAPSATIETDQMHQVVARMDLIVSLTRMISSENMLERVHCLCFHG